MPLGTGSTSHPIEEFLFCQPRAFDAAVLGMSPIGVTLTDDADGNTHVLDIVGAEHYQNIAGFIEEGRQKGISRRFPAIEQYASRLSEGSRLLLAHSRAIITNPQSYLMFEPGEVEHPCPTHVGFAHCGRGTKLADHVPGGADEFCSRLWWQDCTGPCEVPVLPDGSVDENDNRRLFTVGDMKYLALPRLPYCTPEYMVGFFATFPIRMIEVIRDPIGNKHKETLDRVSHASLDVRLVDE